MACEEGSITSILYHLPVESLCRFRCVSKSWKSLLLEPQFIKTHKKTLNRTHLIFCYDRFIYSVPFSNHEAVSTLMKPLLELGKNNFIGSANGLVLTSSYDFRINILTFVVLNFITKDSVELPNFMKHQKGLEDALGFGYDSMTDDYKVVTIFQKLSLTYPSNVYVYSLRTYTWRAQLSDSPYDHFLSWTPRGVFVNGFIHWIAMKGSDHIPVIVAFSLADETFSEVPSPNLYHNGHEVSLYTCKLVALDGKLAIFSDVGLVWLMNEYAVEKSWTKIVVHGYNEITMIKPENLFATHDLARIYYLEEGSFPRSGDMSNMNLRRVISTYVESLVSSGVARISLKGRLIKQ